MLIKTLVAAVSIFCFASTAVADAHNSKENHHGDHGMKGSGLVTVKSMHSVKMTADKLENILKAKGMTVFARIDHGAGAKKVGVELRPTELVIFGNPKVGSPLMACEQSVAIDLPQKMLIWEDAKGETWLGYNKPEYLKARHDIEGCKSVLQKITGALKAFSAAAAK